MRAAAAGGGLDLAARSCEQQNPIRQPAAKSSTLDPNSKMFDIEPASGSARTEIFWTVVALLEAAPEATPGS